MTDALGPRIGVLAAQRLVQLGVIDIQDGLTETEFADVEQHFGFEFSDDHRAFLAAGLPIWTAGHDDHPDQAGWGWPNWRDHESETLQQQVNWPVDSIHRHIAEGHWPTGWGRRPKTQELVKAKTQSLLAEVPRLIPVYAHRYLPAGAGTSGQPVLSVHSLNDIIVYGADLEVYMIQEFHETEVTVPFWRDCL
ncbi:hypothetical protein [Kineosporia sp. NBRC 101731]|uniref:hypothetical protein n=1 Tax=Kineosporia sp. NBRC 101731 TaxID=3032199 RepID=UPI0024A02A23|nr:hypothetical protein [Kineosporia sp. NBRC 101731]GLY26696.1 hypothetical protein Kisp02_00610 [Kineosporia sp. NBRC 101731]